MSPRAKVDLDAVADKCTVLKLTHVAEQLRELVEEAAPRICRPCASWTGCSSGRSR